ncbi:MAG TPA: SUMF1/EgtB/PvdO family nonheme iron enzyme [Labilithrix sp.]|nr:SUMF1/EgtB/PvdO family nonheme iron enzyme [Labilithrix sp.]
MTLETRHVVHGTFIQGTAGADTTHEKDEEPAHQVTITRDFWMGKFPVTREQFAKFVADTRYVTEAEKGASGGAGWDGHALTQRKDFTWRSPGFTQTGEHPVVLVTYGDAVAFTGWASRKTGKHVRLPTEAEWELAARGGTATLWYAGNTEAENSGIGWFKSNAGNGTRPVGQKKANPLGLFDMSGNVFEWCRDIYGPYHEAPAVDPEVTTNPTAEPERRVLRGGSWLRDIKRARSGARYRNVPGSRNADNGFRVVVTNEESVAPGVNGGGGDLAPAGPLGLNGAPTSNPGSASSGGPLADGEPVRLEPIAHTDSFSWSVLLAAPLAAASAVVAWMLLRRKRRAAPVPSPSGVSTRIGDDGFFVRVPNAPHGARARYECMVNGTQVSDVVPLEGEETFVYTGSPPTSVRIVEVVAGPAGGYRTPDRPPAQPGADLGPPSSRSRPPPVPPRRPSGTTSVPPGGVVVTHVHTQTSHHPSSSMPRVAVLMPDATEQMPVAPGHDVPSVTDTVATPALTSEAFLGNPRAY